MVAIVCGANMNFDRLRYIAERTEIGEKREAIFAVTIPEEKGAYLEFCRALKGRVITEFNYRYQPVSQSGKSSAHIFVGIGLKNGEIEHQEILKDLSKYQVTDLTNDEVAKLHIRYLIGGHAQLNDEHLFRVEFPERPGALLTFLERLGQQFNISLFHYRNHGAAEGRVLMGLQLGQHQPSDLNTALDAIAYPYEEITDNAGYQLFLK